MRTNYLAFTALAVAAAMPAMAQTTTPFEDAAMKTVQPCFDIKASEETASAAISACQQALRDIAALKSQTPGLADHDLNVARVVNSMAQTRIGSAYTFQDGNRRTARVCTQMELAWAEVSQLNPAASPGYVPLLKQLTDSSINVIGKCRS